MSLEYCTECNEPTGRAGKHDDSIYTADGRGPLCDNCSVYCMKCDELILLKSAAVFGEDEDQFWCQRCWAEMTTLIPNQSKVNP